MQPVQNLLFSCGLKSLNQQGDLLQADFLLNHEGMLIIRVGAKLEAEMALSSVEQQIRHLMKQPRLSIVFSFTNLLSGSLLIRSSPLQSRSAKLCGSFTPSAD